MARRFLQACCMAAGTWLVVTTSAWAACVAPDRSDVDSAVAPAQLTTEDLVELHDIGLPNQGASSRPTPFGISPDGKRAAFVEVWSDLETNRECRALVMIDLEKRAAARVLDLGGDRLPMAVSMRGLEIPNGAALLVVPRWAPDGRSIAYLRRDEGRTQIWHVDVDGRLSSAEPITASAHDIEEWAWAAQGRAVVYRTTPARAVDARQIDAEGKTGGWRYDARIMPMIGARPLPRAGLPPAYHLLDLETGSLRDATPEEREKLHAANRGSTDAVGPAGRQAHLLPVSDDVLAPRKIEIVEPEGEKMVCDASACTGRITALWWTDQGRALLFSTLEGWAERYTALYRWTPGDGEPVRLLRTDAHVTGCALAANGLLCVAEQATSPSRAVMVDGWGAIRSIYDPNPAFASFDMAPAQRLTWRADDGTEVFGDLVLPRHIPSEGKLPLVIVQYSSRGFLRGGTGDEYPIQLLAQRGLAVLSVQRAFWHPKGGRSFQSYEDLYTAGIRNWRELRHQMSALVNGVKLAATKAPIDQERLGISGLSAGSTVARFALVNSNLFKAASISTCCVDETSYLAGPAWMQFAIKSGYPIAYPPDVPAWRDNSIALNAATFDTPILMQLAEAEYLTAVPTVSALNLYGKPVEMFIYPGEYHIKSQPRHRLSVYRRNVDWFAFWLKSEENPNPVAKDQFVRWREMRDHLGQYALSKPEAPNDDYVD